MIQKNDVAIIQHEDTVAESVESEKGFIRPATDVYESDVAYVLMIDLPGTEKESISVTMDPTTLVVKGRVRTEHGERAKLLFQELRTPGYHRLFNLGKGIERNTVEATFENGVLTVKLFKSEESRPREIHIN
jgi:HSP20 family protein